MSSIEQMADSVPCLAEAREVETALLGSVVCDPVMLDKVVEHVTGEDFYDADFGQIFECLVNLRQAQKPIGDVSLIIRELDCMGLLSQFAYNGYTGRVGITKLAKAHYEVSFNAPYHAAMVRRYAQLRLMHQASIDAAFTAYNPAANPSDLAERAISRFESVIARDIDDDKEQDLSKLAAGEVDEIEQCCIEGRSLGISTGFGSIDDISGGFYPGDSIVLAARPSIGKSAFALEIATRVARQNLPVLFVSLEMTGKQIANRLLSRETGIPVKRIQKAELTRQERDLLQAAKLELSNQAMPIKLMAAGSATPARIAARARVQRSQIGLSLIVIDYLGLVNSTDKHKSLYERVSAVSREIKQVAQSLEVPILLLAQLNREGAKGMPTLEHLRDSGAIEQDADGVWFLHREDRTARDTKLIVAKQRQGEVGTIEFDYDGGSMSFTESIGASQPAGGRPWTN